MMLLVPWATSGCSTGPTASYAPPTYRAPTEAELAANPWLGYREDPRSPPRVRVDSGPVVPPPPSQRLAPDEYSRMTMMLLIGQQGLMDAMSPPQPQRRPMTYCNPQGAGMVCWSE